MTENQIALLKIVVFLEYVSHAPEKGELFLLQPHVGRSWQSQPLT